MITKSLGCIEADRHLAAKIFLDHLLRFIKTLRSYLKKALGEKSPPVDAGVLSELFVKIKIIFCAIIALSSHAYAAPKKTSAPPTPVDYRETAARELVSETNAEAPTQLGTPATVIASSAPVENPIAYNGVLLGISLQQFKPKGLGRVIGLRPYNYDTLLETPMVGLQFRWLPWQLTTLGAPQMGVFISARYAKHTLPSYTQADVDIGNTELHTLWTDLGFASQWNIPGYETVSVGAEFTIGRLDSVQSSENKLANSSEYLWMTGAGVAAKKRFANSWIGLTYGRQFESFGKKEVIGIASDHLILGFSYALR